MPRSGVLVLAIVFVTLGLVYGLWYSYSVLLVALLREMAWSRSAVAGAFSIMLLVHGAAGPGLGWVISRVGPRRVLMGGGLTLGAALVLAAETREPWHFYAAFGVLGGLGISASGWVPSVLIVRQWMAARIGTAVGISSAGIGVGMFALVPLVQALIDWLGLRWTLRVLGVLLAGWIVGAASWLPRDREPAVAPAAVPTPEARGPQWTLLAAVRSKRFWGLAAVFGCGSFATQMLLVHQVAYLVDHGVSASEAAVVGGLVGLASIPGKAGWGALSDRVGRELAYTLAFACVVASVGLLRLAGHHPESGLPYAYAVMIGVGYAVTAPLTPAVASDLFAGPRFPTIFGTLHVFNSLGGAVGAWAAGWTFDATGGYGAALLAAAGLAALAPTLLWLVAPRRPNPPPAV